MNFPKTDATVHTLKNGLTVILDADSSAPVISTQVWVETGSVHEGEFLGAGISHLLEHMVFKGTKSFDSESLSQTVQGAGGQWNAYTTFDRTVYYIDGPAEGSSTFLQVLLEMVFSPSFPEDEFEKEKNVIRREIDMGMDDADSRASRQLFDTAFANDDRKQPVIGHLELFNKITREDMMQYHQTRYTTENAFVSISGEFDKNEMLEKLEDLTKDIGRSFTHPAQPAMEPEQQGARSATMHFNVPATKYTLAWQAPHLEHADSAALDLASSILGGGRSSRLYQRLREEKALCLHVGAWSYLPTQSPGMIAVSAELDEAKREEFEQAVHEEILCLLNDSLDKELEKAKRMTLSAQFKTLTTASGRASDLASNWHEARNLDYTADYLKKIDAVTIHDIRRVVETWMTREQTLTRVTMLPSGMEKELGAKEQAVATERKIIEKELPSGLQVKICEDKKVPLVSIVLAVKTGMGTESLATSGLNTLLANVLIKGTKTRSGAEIAEKVEALGASLNFSSGNNTTIARASCLMPDLEPVVELLADCLINPILPQDAIDRAKAIQINEIQESALDPVSLAFRELKKAMFGDSGYGLPASGTEESVAALDRMTLYAQHAAHFNASNMVVSIFGDVETEHAYQIVDKYLGKCSAGAEPKHTPQVLLESSEQEFFLDKQQAVLTIGFPGCDVSSPDRYALGLLNAWFSDMAGPLFSKIREELGLAYFVSSTMLHGIDCGSFSFYMGTSPEQLELARKELLGIVSEVAEKGMDEATLERVKTSWLAKQALANQSNAAMAGLCTIDSLLGLGANHFLETTEKVKELTTKEIQRVAQHYFGQAKPSIVTVQPAP